MTKLEAYGMTAEDRAIFRARMTKRQRLQYSLDDKRGDTRQSATAIKKRIVSVHRDQRELLPTYSY